MNQRGAVAFGRGRPLWRDDEVALHGEVVTGHGAGELQLDDVLRHDPLQFPDAAAPLGQADVSLAARDLQLGVGADPKLCAKPAVLLMRKMTVSPGVTGICWTCSPACRKRIAATRLELDDASLTTGRRRRLRGAGGGPGGLGRHGAHGGFGSVLGRHGAHGGFGSVLAAGSAAGAPAAAEKVPCMVV